MLAAARSTSCRVIAPPRPLPCTVTRSTPSSAASSRTSGALGYRAIAEEAGGHPGVAAHAVGEREAHGQRQPTTDDRVPGVETGLGVERVHATAAAAAAPGGLAVHLRHQRVDRYPADQGVAVLPVSGDDGVFGRQCLVHAYRDRFLPDVEVDEAMNLAALYSSTQRSSNRRMSTICRSRSA